MDNLENFDILVIPKNSGLKKCKEYAQQITKDSSKILEVRGEDVPLFVEKLCSYGKRAIGITGEDLFTEFKLEKPSTKVDILEIIPWEDDSAIYGRPTLCILGPKGKTLTELPKKLKIGINKKYKNIAEKFISSIKEKNIELIYLSGSTESTFSNNLVDLVIDIIYSGKSAEMAGLSIYQKIMESNMVLIGKKEFIDYINFDKMDNLIPTIIQDEQKNILTLSYSSYESLQRAIESKKVWTFSRSRGRSIMKGEQSGNTQEIISIKTDCDNDTLIFTVKPNGPACHLGDYSCFEGINKEFDLEELYNKILEKTGSTDAKSYTRSLVNDPEVLKRKLIEEAAEVITAKNKEELIWEAADLIYFLFVILSIKGVTIRDIEKENERRNNQTNEKINKTRIDTNPIGDQNENRN